MLNRKNIFFSFAVLLVLFFVLILRLYLLRNSYRSIFIRHPDNLTLIYINNKPFFVEVANTPDLQRKGLSGKTSIPHDEGMIFLFPQKDFYPSFVMRGMQFPLDFIWINDDKITQITQNVPVPEVKNSIGQILRPDRPIDYVVELNAGTTDRYHFTVGNPVDITNINSSD